MAVPVRINEDNYVALQLEADSQRRSIVAQLNVILDERYERSSVGMVLPRTATLKGFGKSLDGLEVNLIGEQGFAKVTDNPNTVNEVHLETVEIDGGTIEYPVVTGKGSMKFCKHNAVKGFCKLGCK